MSEELKTLKEIREQVYSQCKDEAEKRLLEHLFSSEDEEAVKWVKEHRDRMWNWTEDTWMDFFNLTEEDLK